VLTRLLIASILVGLSYVPVAALEQTCRGQDIKFSAPENRLVITDVAITRGFTNCPVLTDDIGRTFAAVPRQRVYVWFRLEGTETFLEQVGPNDLFEATIYRTGDVVEGVSPLEIRRPRINVEAARAETLSNAGHFDWRMRTDIAAFNVPGIYTLTLWFAGRRICLQGGPCALIFRVE
jgi:hypothetical protein